MSARWIRDGDVWSIAVGGYAIDLYQGGRFWRTTMVVRFGVCLRGARRSPKQALDDLACMLAPYDADAAARVARLRGPRGTR